MRPDQCQTKGTTQDSETIHIYSPFFLLESPRWHTSYLRNHLSFTITPLHNVSAMQTFHLPDNDLPRKWTSVVTVRSVVRLDIAILRFHVTVILKHKLLKTFVGYRQLQNKQVQEYRREMGTRGGGDICCKNRCSQYACPCFLTWRALSLHMSSYSQLDIIEISAMAARLSGYK